MWGANDHWQRGKNDTVLQWTVEISVSRRCVLLCVSLWACELVSADVNNKGCLLFYRLQNMNFYLCLILHVSECTQAEWDLSLCEPCCISTCAWSVPIDARVCFVLDLVLAIRQLPLHFFPLFFFFCYSSELALCEIWVGACGARWIRQHTRKNTNSPCTHTCFSK